MHDFGMHLEPDELLDPVLFRESLDDALTMLPYALNEVDVTPIYKAP
jgi:hypothetical protein